MATETATKESSATRGAYLKLREMILTGEIEPGFKLKIEQLRRLLELGSSPVREALSLLTSDKLVERIDQRGFRAAPVSKENFEEILMLRCTLEDMALRASIANADAPWEERLILKHYHMNKARGHDVAVFEAAHKAFHMALLDQSGLPMLEGYCSQLYDLNIRYRYLAAGGESYQKRSIETEHQEIMNAAIGKNTDSACELLLSHYRRTGEYLSSQMDT
ncbi:GntR family transcriptional regulator [Aliiroseovarius subalbicans]|uniref:GntR family transcriptional regulator n=1 Tax=Aliiroseovarius subalbicans TaxID=2925840 RepID=UPI0023B08D0A|nr:GntR family transcriptional regulator [Aliiroseovarius subalbicans]